MSYGANTVRDGVSLTPRRELRALALPSEIMRLPNLTGYLKFPGPFPVAGIRLKYVKRPTAAERFVPRGEALHPAIKLPAPPAGNEQNTHVPAADVGNEHGGTRAAAAPDRIVANGRVGRHAANRKPAEEETGQKTGDTDSPSASARDGSVDPRRETKAEADQRARGQRRPKPHAKRGRNAGQPGRTAKGKPARPKSGPRRFY